jgi:uncharacterized protein YdeI (BOF family)
MTVKALLALIALMVSPALALAQGCDHGNAQSASQCGEGQTWDAASQSCVTPINS